MCIIKSILSPQFILLLFSCTYEGCNEVFGMKSKLSRHIREKHIESKNIYSCLQCFQTFHFQSELKNHKERNKSCHSSHKTSSSSSSSQLSANKKFKCDYCGESYTRKGNLKSHILYKCSKRTGNAKKPGNTYVTKRYTFQ